jgi:hypothetical protein
MYDTVLNKITFLSLELKAPQNKLQIICYYAIGLPTVLCNTGVFSLNKGYFSYNLFFI